MHDPELLIRTGGEQRLSNYLLWQVAESELVFSDQLWPGFSRKSFERRSRNSAGARNAGSRIVRGPDRSTVAPRAQGTVLKISRGPGAMGWERARSAPGHSTSATTRPGTREKNLVRARMVTAWRFPAQETGPAPLPPRERWRVPWWRGGPEEVFVSLISTPLNRESQTFLPDTASEAQNSDTTAFYRVRTSTWSPRCRRLSREAAASQSKRENLKRQ